MPKTQQQIWKERWELWERIANYKLDERIAKVKRSQAAIVKKFSVSAGTVTKAMQWDSKGRPKELPEKMLPLPPKPNKLIVLEALIEAQAYLVNLKSYGGRFAKDKRLSAAIKKIEFAKRVA